jgi:hypothetical protein
MNFFSFFALAFAVVKDVSHWMDVPISAPPFPVFSPLLKPKVTKLKPLEIYGIPLYHILFLF